MLIKKDTLSVMQDEQVLEIAVTIVNNSIVYT